MLLCRSYFLLCKFAIICNIFVGNIFYLRKNCFTFLSFYASTLFPILFFLILIYSLGALYFFQEFSQKLDGHLLVTSENFAFYSSLMNLFHLLTRHLWRVCLNLSYFCSSRSCFPAFIVSSFNISNSIPRCSLRFFSALTKIEFHSSLHYWRLIQMLSALEDFQSRWN